MKIDSSFDVVRRQTRPVMTVHTLVVPGNAQCLSGSKTTLIRHVEYNSLVLCHTELIVADRLLQISNDLRCQENVQQTLTSLYHFWVAFTRVHYSPNSTYEYFIWYGNILYCLNVHHNRLPVNNVLMHRIVSFRTCNSPESRWMFQACKRKQEPYNY